MTGMKIGVIGAGAWGTALAMTAARAGHAVTLWAREPQLVQDMLKMRENTLYLPGHALPDNVGPTHDPAQMTGQQIVLLVAPAQATRAVMTDFAAYLGQGTPLVICAKGIEQETGKFLTGVVREAAPRVRPFVLSGPSFAADVAAGLPAAVTLAGEDIASARAIARALSHRDLRLYSSSDPLGAQIGGAMKNVLAIACGIVEGKGLGDSARAALVTRAFAELARFGHKLGAQAKTLSGLSGLGDLMLTATSPQSRNYSLGLELGRGAALEDILKRRRAVTEGVHTAKIAVRMADEMGIDMPICRSVAAIVTGRSTPDAEISRLLERPLRDETE